MSHKTMVSIRDGEPASGHSRQCYLKPSVRSTVVVSCWINTLPTSYLRSFSYYRFYIDTAFAWFSCYILRSCVTYHAPSSGSNTSRPRIQGFPGFIPFRNSGSPDNLVLLLNMKNDLSVHALQIESCLSYLSRSGCLDNIVKLKTYFKFMIHDQIS